MTITSTQASARVTKKARARRRGGNRAAIGISVGRVVIILLFLALWQLASDRWIADRMISSPVHVVERIVDVLKSGEIKDDFATTAIEFVLGYVGGIVAGLVLGLALGAWPTVGKLLEPLISAINGIPKIALGPIIILWLGIGLESKVGIAIMTVFFVMFYNIYIGMRGVPQELVNTLRIFGASKAEIIRTVILPSLNPAILSGLRSGIPFAVIGVIVGEFLAATEGLGYYIRQANDAYDAAGIFTGIAFLMVLVFAMNLLVTIWERYSTRWQR